MAGAPQSAPSLAVHSSTATQYKNKIESVIHTGMILIRKNVQGNLFNPTRRKKEIFLSE